MTESPETEPAPLPPVAPVVPVEPSLWQVVRGVRLAMLLDTPLAYGSTFAREVAFPDELWVDRMADSSGWLAFEGELPVGSVTAVPRARPAGRRDPPRGHVGGLARPRPGRRGQPGRGPARPRPSTPVCGA